LILDFPNQTGDLTEKALSRVLESTNNLETR